MNTTTTNDERTAQADTITSAAKVKILMVADGRISFDKERYFSLGVLVEVLKQSQAGRPMYEITTAHRGVSTPNWPIDADLNEFKFDRHDLNLYDQVWLFGDSPTRSFDHKFLPEPELEALARFMDNGGGVFATGDHEDLGVHLCGNVPRVRTMRAWYFSKDSPWGGPRAPEQKGPDRHDTLVAGNRTGCPGARPPYVFEDESDDRPQKLQLRTYGDAALPHPLLSSHRGAIDVLPDHPHEGVCLVPADLTQTFKFAKYTGPEYPLIGGERPAPEVIATSTVSGGHTTTGLGLAKPSVTGRTFGAIGAYDGHRAGVGRVVVDSTWHHFMNWNLRGGKKNGEQYACPAQQAGFRFSEEGRAALEKIEAYFRNIACWLVPAARRPALTRSLLWNIAWSFPALEFLDVRPLADMRFADVVQVGGATFDSLAGMIGAGNATLVVLDLLRSVEGFDTARFPGLDPWTDDAAREAPAAARQMSAMIRDAALGGALQRLVEDHANCSGAAANGPAFDASLLAGVQLALAKADEEILRSSQFLLGQAMLRANPATVTSEPRAARDEPEVMDWTGLVRHYVDLALPLMFIRAPRGVLACGYFSAKAFDHPDGAIAGVVVNGVRTFDDMLHAVVADGNISALARAEPLNITAGMTGKQVLERLRKP